METIQSLKAEIIHHNRAASNLLAEKGSRHWSMSDQAAFDRHMDDADGAQRLLDAALKTAQDTGKTNIFDVSHLSPKDARKKEELKAGLDVFLRKSPDQYTPQDAASVRNTMSTTTGSEGGFTVAPLVASEVIRPLKDYGSMRRVASSITTINGADMGWPSTDGRYEVGEFIANNATATSADPVFQTAPVNVAKFSSKIMTVPIELIQDSQFDMAGFIFSRAAERIGRAQNIGFTTGTGTGQPYGITVAAPRGLFGGTGDTGLSAINYDLLVTLVDTIDVAYLQEPNIVPTVKGRGPGWMFNQTVRRYLRKIKDPLGRPIWSPSYDKGITVAADRLLGYPVYINNDMPSPAANAVSLAFGNFDKYMVRDAMEVTLFRFEDSVYSSKGQVGFLAWARAGGNLLDSAAVTTYQHSAT